MRVVFSQEVKITLFEISDFIDSINTDGAGNRWVARLTDWVGAYAKSNVSYSICRNEAFAEDGLSCITFNGWVIAFKIENDEFVVYQIVRGDILV